MRRYTDRREVAALIDELCRFEAHFEQWLPKAELMGRTSDLRVVVIAGAARQMVARTSAGPITNLHLGNARGELAALLARWPDESRAAALRSCCAAAAAFPRSLYVGVDLALLPGLRRHSILEVNAFGDLLPGVLDRGQDTYTAELAATYRV